MNSKATLAILLLAIAGVGTYVALSSSTSKTAVSSSYGFEVRDERQLVGDADNVFVGRVVDQVSSEPLPGVGEGPDLPRTQFSVEVKKNIKGNLRNTVTVSQSGGKIKQNGNTVVVEEGSLLKPGEKYLLVTKYNEQQDYYQITTPGYGNILIKNKSDLQKTVKKFSKAKEEQIDPSKTQVPSEQIPSEYLNPTDQGTNP